MISRSRRIIERAMDSLFLVFLLVYCTGPANKPASAFALIKDSGNQARKPETFLSGQSKPHTDTVVINDMRFQPEEIRVRSGDTIVWVNRDLVTHCVNEASHRAWASPDIASGGSWRMVVTGNATYYCTIHPVMKGRIVVK
jgi:plastocyanin